MIKFILAAMAATLCLSAPAFAQTFSQTHGAKGYHSHDITTYTVNGSCCCCCGANTSTELLGAAHQTTRTYVRRYTHPTVERRTYTRIVEPQATYNYSREYRRAERRVVHHGAQSHHQERVLTHDERRERDYARAAEGHSDRARAWAHYDRRWRSRTNDKRH
mgnify:CR=1 FL=1